MTGGASDLATFMKQIVTERTRTRNKLDRIDKRIENIEQVVDHDQNKNGKILDDLVKRTVIIEKKMQDINYEFVNQRNFKKR